MDQNIEIIWGPGFLTEGNEYVVETYHVDTLLATYKGTYKKREKAIPYVILYDVRFYDTHTKTFSEITCSQWIFYRTDKFYDADDYK
jgi:hypothetical protein